MDDAALCGGIADTAPRAPAYLGKGQWTKLEVWYTAATDDTPARIDRVDLAGVTVQENVEVTGATVGRAPIRIVGDEGRIALRDIRAKPLDRPADGAAEWTFLDPADDWSAWEAWGDARFDITNEGLVGRGALGHLWAPAEDLGDVACTLGGFVASLSVVFVVAIALAANGRAIVIVGGGTYTTHAERLCQKARCTAGFQFW